MSPHEIQKIYEQNHDTLMEKLKRLHKDKNDSEVLYEIVELLRANKTLFEQVYDDRGYALAVSKRLTGEFEAIKGD